MKKEVTLAMTQKQINRYHVIKDSLEGKLTVKGASMALGISERQIIRLREGVKHEGAAYLIHKNTERSPIHAMTDEERREIIDRYQTAKYEGANFLHYSELLLEHEGIKRSQATIHRVLVGAGFTSPKKRRRYKPHRARKRNVQEGLLMQLDASPYRWLGGNAMYSLHGGIDDATSKITGLYMAKNECLQGYFEVMRQTVESNGVPVSVYADRHTIFRSPKADKLTVEEQLSGQKAADTQFGRALKELGITLIAARSPQAKGRIERLWETLQSRLLIEFRIHDIKTVHEANVFFNEYIQHFNAQFAVEPEQFEKAYVPTSLNLDLILCVKEKRTADNGGVFSFHGKRFKIINYDVSGKAIVDVIASASRGIFVMRNDMIYDVIVYLAPVKTRTPSSVKIHYSPPVNHPFRRSISHTLLYSSDLVDSEIRNMLSDIFLSKYA